MPLRSLTSRVRSAVSRADGPPKATATTWFMVALLGGAGVAHFVKPDTYQAFVPSWFPAAPTVVAVSGVAEIGCAGLLAMPATRRVGGWASAALMVGVFPANIDMAVTAVRHRVPAQAQALTLARLPLQLPLIWWSLKAAGVGPGRP
ncbi:DoxX family protein [Nakamurella leprariae]|uniref:Methylamine utilisation protein MauE domain-containing protein n=1 Tax=Nakamurella leprariae TaxID=2803911 RepID=A0A939C1N2_9ACTN|nr:MauE/DoxX family redox-associated membrane protein [Nakamurella leprariae]MBM9467334.1 hypothetical protein [Nakamurella leprariae]